MLMHGLRFECNVLFGQMTSQLFLHYLLKYPIIDLRPHLYCIKLNLGLLQDFVICLLPCLSMPQAPHRLYYRSLVVCLLFFFPLQLFFLKVFLTILASFFFFFLICTLVLTYLAPKANLVGIFI